MKKKKWIGTIFVVSVLIMLAGCGAADRTDRKENQTVQKQDVADEAKNTDGQTKESKIQEETQQGTYMEDEENGKEKQMAIEVDGQSFSAKLYDNATAEAFLEKLPMTLDMEELNGNEKYYFMEDALPADTEDVRDIRTGDIMLYGADCLVLFFQDFATSYRYTRIGYIEDREGFADALSDGTVKIRFSPSQGSLSAKLIRTPKRS